MGQHLAIGFPYQIFVTPERTYNQTISLEDVRGEMERSLYYDMRLFDAEEREKSQVFTLKNEPLKEGLIPFLESFYPKIYSKDDEEYPNVLETLRSTPFEQWLDFARDKSSYAFQLDTHTSLMYLTIQKDFRPKICLRLDCLSLYVGSGKIFAEAIGDFTRFFKLCVQETFSQHPIVKAIEIYVAG
jgi:hypothetical protein